MQPRRFDDSRSVNAPPGSSLVVIGNFDGVHRGHQAVIEAARKSARASGLGPLVLTFHPHPAEVLGRGARPPLTAIERKLELFARTWPDLAVVVEPFTRELSELSPEEFARGVLLERLGARVVIVGENFRFGHGRAGDLRALESLGRSLGFETRSQPLVGDAEGAFSSTRVREALAEGDLERVERCLGRPHAFSGRVLKGDGRGRQIGFPTANLGELAELLPPDGVYACLVDREHADRGAQVLGVGALNVGVRPTLSAGRSVEVHVAAFSGDLYECRLRVHLVARLRGERRFADVAALVEQIGRDVAEAERACADRKPAADAGGAWA